ncbi:MAG TPA: cysteine--tRNA ligase [Chthoniobacteraceae bacterium]|nr:cysteine--tRNA ligase [Chthoniobacteraceae bacterium]
MAIRFTNTYSREIEDFAPMNPPQVKMYTCGPTVYDHAHIGNFRAYIFEDLLQRQLEFRGYRVERVMNLTDVDDKTIRRCQEAGMPLAQFTQQFKTAFFEDIKTLNIKPAAFFPSATDPQYIAKMIAMIEELVKGDYAYQAEDKSVYFRLGKFPDYGKLAHLNLEELRPTGRIRNDEYEKESIGDFALWKAWDAADGEVGWESPWGRGRPGWHIECSAMAVALLGPQMDIHCGGVDNIFPHHEAEIAQSECCTGKRFVKYWLHCAHLMVEGRKMSKSEHNFYTLRDLLDQGWTGREVRYALINVHYRLMLNFTFDGLAAARASLLRIDEWVDRLTKFSAAAQGPSACALPAQAKFEEALDDDLNISGALGHLFDAIRESNRAIDEAALTPADALALLQWWNRINTVLGLERPADNIPAEILALLEERKKAREAKDWKKSDELRAAIEAKGWIVKDMKAGQKVTRKL